mgnify:CR=1 FL=1
MENNYNNYQLLGIIGNPLRQSLSPILHNYWMKRYDINGVYIPICLENISKINTALKSLNFKGLNVTIPFKKKIIPHLDFVDKDAKNLEAVNTIVNIKGKLKGYNTDLYGFSIGLEKAKKWNPEDPVVILGAGGASEAAIAGVLKLGATKIFIMNRTPSKILKLTRKYENVKKADWLCTRTIKSAGLFINTTSLGMRGYSEIPIKQDVFNKNVVIYDIVYNPLETKLIKLAQQSNLSFIQGMDMFVNQAAKSFSLWFGKNPSISSQTIKLIKNNLFKK